MKKNAQDVVDGGIESMVGKYLRNLGSVRGGAAPRLFKNIGGPLVGSALQSLLLGGLGYGAGSLIAPLYTDDPRRRKQIRRTLAALGAMGGPMANLLPLGSNIGQLGSKLMTDPRKALGEGIFSQLNRPATMYKDSQMMVGPDPTGGMLEEGETFNPYAQEFFHRSSIPVGQMTEMVRRSGLPSDKANPLIYTMQEAAGGTRGLISPSNIFRTGMKLGVGYLVGRPAMGLTSKILGAVAGTSRSTQQKLTRYGTLGIMLYNAFGGRR